MHLNLEELPPNPTSSNLKEAHWIKSFRFATARYEALTNQVCLLLMGRDQASKKKSLKLSVVDESVDHQLLEKLVKTLLVSSNSFLTERMSPPSYQLLKGIF